MDVARQRRGGLGVTLLVAPTLAFLFVFFVLPIGYVLLLSVTDPTVSLEHTAGLSDRSALRQRVLNTFKTSLIVTLACLVSGLSARLRDGATQRC